MKPMRMGLYGIERKDGEIIAVTPKKEMTLRRFAARHYEVFRYEPRKLRARMRKDGHTLIRLNAWAEITKRRDVR